MISQPWAPPSGSVGQDLLKDMVTELNTKFKYSRLASAKEGVAEMVQELHLAPIRRLEKIG